jgi:hypothetical protein
VGPVGVVVLPPGIQGGLQGGDGPEPAAVVQQLDLQRLVQPLELACGRRGGGLGEPLVMPFSRQIRSNSTSAGRGLMNRPVNTVPLSVSTSSGTP